METENGVIGVATQATQTKIDRLLRPRSIALIGASATPGSLGECVLTNLESAGFEGELYLVNPKRPIVHGRQCLGSIDELPMGIDCAVLAVPASAVLAAAQACALKSAGSLIVFSAGFAESGEHGQSAQQELARIARDHGMILEGPNCLGMVNYIDGIPLTFVLTPPQAKTDLPGAAIVSQSGALAAVIAVNMRHHRIALTYSISTGNEAASGVEDYVEHLIGDKATRVLALVVEQFRRPKMFLELARRACGEGKHIVLFHPGSSKAARVSATTHTGAIAGDYDVMHTLVTRAGVIHVNSMEELVDVTQILVRCPERPCGSSAVFTESGAFKALALDLCDRLDLDLPPFSPRAEAALRAALPSFIPPSNPLDLTAQALVDPDLYRRTLPPVLDDDGFGSVLLAIILTDHATTELKLPRIVDAIRTLKPAKPVIFAALDEGAPFNSQHIDELRSLGVPCFPSPERAIRALARVSHGSAAEAGGRCREARGVPPSLAESGVLPEYRSKQILAQLGIEVPAGRLARTHDEAIDVAWEIGFPVVLKAQASDLKHKSDAGAVILGVESEDALAEAWAALVSNVHANCPGVILDGILVERMAEKAVELIVGARNDPQWGPVVLIGFGGVLAEAIKDTRLIPPDLSQAEIERELGKLRCGALLKGFRGSPALDVCAAAQAVSRVGDLARAWQNLLEIDINPLAVYAEGKGAVALDALMVFGGVGAADKTQTKQGALDESR
jgi:acetate---CoA ligase (ADP-forming)